MEKLMKKATLAPLLLLLVVSTNSNAQDSMQQSQQHIWWEFGLGDPILEEVALFYLGTICAVSLLSVYT
jgi:hypothetical protein